MKVIVKVAPWYDHLDLAPDILLVVCQTDYGPHTKGLTNNSQSKHESLSISLEACLMSLLIGGGINYRLLKSPKSCVVSYLSLLKKPSYSLCFHIMLLCSMTNLPNLEGSWSAEFSTMFHLHVMDSFLLKWFQTSDAKSGAPELRIPAIFFQRSYFKLKKIPPNTVLSLGLPLL